MNDHIKLLSSANNQDEKTYCNSKLDEFHALIEDFSLEELSQINDFMETLIDLQGNYDVIPIKDFIKIKE